MRQEAIRTILMLGLVGIFCGVSLAGEMGHYPLGSEGVKGGTIPPPGTYYRMYTTYYYADKVMGSDGHRVDTNYQLHLFANVHRMVWVSHTKMFGADYFADALIPFLYTEVEAKALGADDHDFCYGDINIEPFGLAWHQPRYDVSFGLSVFAPTGKFDKNNPASPGKDFWTQMTTLGGTWYPDKEKTWSASILSRYEINSKKDHSDVRPGRDFLFEWGISKMIPPWELGVAGYSEWQVGDDSGSDVTWDKSVHDRVSAIGPEINLGDPAMGCFYSLRVLKEFSTVDRPEGWVATFTWTKCF